MNHDGLKTLLQDIAPAQAMRITPTEYTAGKLTLSAPLEPNLNDKGTGFAGSMASMLSLAGWGTITTVLHAAQIQADVMMVQSEMNYLKPATGELRADAQLSAADRELLLREIRTRSRARQRIEAVLFSNGIECARMIGHYAVILTGLGD